LTEVEKVKKRRPRLWLWGEDILCEERKSFGERPRREGLLGRTRFVVTLWSDNFEIRREKGAIGSEDMNQKRHPDHLKNEGAENLSAEMQQ